MIFFGLLIFKIFSITYVKQSICYIILGLFKHSIKHYLRSQQTITKPTKTILLFLMDQYDKSFITASTNEPQQVNLTTHKHSLLSRKENRAQIWWNPNS